MPKPRALSPDEARRTLANRFGPRADRLRQLATKFGIRPIRVFLVWQRWSGAERGEGSPAEIFRAEVLPTPKVQSLDSVAINPITAGMLAMGTVRLTEVSAQLTSDVLAGLRAPGPAPVPGMGEVDHIPQPFSFHWELFEDGRGDDPALRWKYRLAALPARRAGMVDWTVLLEKVSEDPRRDGTSAYLSGDR